MLYNFVADSIHTKKLYGRLSSSEVYFLYGKRLFCVLSLLWKALEHRNAVHLNLIGKLLVDFSLVIIELFR